VESLTHRAKLAAAVCGISRGEDLRIAFRRAVAAGTAALLSPGTDLCGTANVDKLLNDVVISEM
jgi:6-phosphofructokinase 2